MSSSLEIIARAATRGAAGEGGQEIFHRAADNGEGENAPKIALFEPGLCLKNRHEFRGDRSVKP